eukprot:COSAG05_NODE_1253_length_5369_cov_14.480674_6_plen_29_part_01
MHRTSRAFHAKVLVTPIPTYFSAGMNTVE